VWEGEEISEVVTRDCRSAVKCCQWPLLFTYLHYIYGFSATQQHFCDYPLNLLKPTGFVTHQEFLRSDSHLHVTQFFSFYLSQSTEHVLCKDKSIKHAEINLNRYEFSLRIMSKMCIGSVNHTHENLRQNSLLFSAYFTLHDLSLLYPPTDWHHSLRGESIWVVSLILSYNFLLYFELQMYTLFWATAFSFVLSYSCLPYF
jgi:hypothetical protein